MILNVSVTQRLEMIEAWTILKLTVCTWQDGGPQKEAGFVFQSSIFKGKHVSFMEGIKIHISK